LKTSEFAPDLRWLCVRSYGPCFEMRIVDSMAEPTELKQDSCKGLLLLVSALGAITLPATIGILDAPVGYAQSPVASISPLPKEGKLEFEVASVRQNKTNDKASMNVGPTPGDKMASTGGLYSARNIVLVQYIAFA
jgi:hypothetical protein